MAILKRIKLLSLACCLCFGSCFFVQSAFAAECDCTSDAAIPPFLSAGADPNLLLMIDNSASMYDVAYTDTTDDGSFCFDDTFITGTDYAGYYEKDTWYAYNLATDRFEIAADGACAGGTVYSNDDVCVATTEGVDGEGNPFTVVDAARAKGNLLNWASASKFDIEKVILTGGKYDEASGFMESEGRGCTGNRFIKQVTVKSGVTSYKLVLGVRADYDQDDGIDTTLIDIFPLTIEGFVPGNCQLAIDLMMGDPGGFGGVKKAIEDCMPYDELKPGDKSKQALTHSLHDCWYLDKHDGEWPGGGAQGFNFEKWCKDVYTRIDPREITSDDPAYVCAGDGTTVEMNNKSFIGECWNPPGVCHDVLCGERALGDRERCEGGFIEYCTDWNSGKGECKKDDDWETVVDCGGGAAAGSWKWAEGSDELDVCITAARERFCGFMVNPQVPDPSDLQSTTGETWNIPAMLMDQGAVAQVGLPIGTTKGIVEKDGEPAGLLQEFSSKIRIGAMKFNKNGAATECAWEEARQNAIDEDRDFYVSITRNCGDDVKDGAKVIHPIGSDSETAGHTEDLVTAINDTKADSWTPLAEAMYTAIGYYTQRAGMELNSTLGDADFSGWDAPLTEWCQKNNILFITDGASTADLNPIVTAFGDLNGDPDGNDDTVSAVVPCPDLDNDKDNKCGYGDLYGSTYFDDMTYYAWQGEEEDLYPDKLWFEEYPKKINTFVVFTGKDEAGGDEGNPKTLLDNAAENGGTDAALLADNPDDLKRQIENVLKSIMERAAAGSAASVIAATRSGEGAVYQAIFWPDVNDISKELEASWLGEVHGLLVDAEGTLHEDTNGDRALSDTDASVVFYFDEALSETRVCYGDYSGGVCSGTVKNLHEVKYIWSAAEWLADISEDDILSNRTTYISNEKKRYIFTWNDLDADGVVDGRNNIDSDEVLSFIPVLPADNWAELSVDAGRQPVPLDFGMVANADMSNLISWLRGKDNPAAPEFRKREVVTPPNFTITGAPETITWRLGDIIHSTPTSVGRPAEVYHLIYKDSSYAEFYLEYEQRRHVIYFGGNDGMLHAVNGGFYSESGKKFCKTDTCSDEDTGPELGAELWAYVPYNLQSHLHCLSQSGYLHQYYMDSKPRIFDVNIFPDDAVHINGWGTILVVGMRFGGSKLGATADAREFISAYVILDITNPELPPVLLGELTFDPGVSAEMGYSSNIPAVLPMREVQMNADGSVSVLSNDWYLVVGSGPTNMDGTSDQNARIGVFPLNDLGGGSPGAFRIPNAAPSIVSAAGSLALPGAVNGFASDPISIDFGLESFKMRGDVLYFGTVEGTWGDWGGKLYRWVTNSELASKTPDDWAAPSLLFNPDRPITSAPSSGWDGFNFWVYFGTGRFFHKNDKTDAGSNAQEAFYGIKEPIDLNNDFTWNEVGFTDALGGAPADGDLPGTRKLFRSDQVIVYQANKASEANLGCAVGGCLPAGVNTFAKLDAFVGGFGLVYDPGTGDAVGFSGTDGWYLQFPDDRERNLGQATLLGGLNTFTTYQPFDDQCRPEGEANLYGVFYRTGTAWYKSVFDEEVGVAGDPPAIVSRMEIGRGLATTPNLHVGREDGAKAFVQTSTGAIVEIEQPELPLGNSKSGRTKWLDD